MNFFLMILMNKFEWLSNTSNNYFKGNFYAIIETSRDLQKVIQKYYLECWVVRKWFIKL